MGAFVHNLFPHSGETVEDDRSVATLHIVEGVAGQGEADGCWDGGSVDEPKTLGSHVVCSCRDAKQLVCFRSAWVDGGDGRRRAIDDIRSSRTSCNEALMPAIHQKWGLSLSIGHHPS